MNASRSGPQLVIILSLVSSLFVLLEPSASADDADRKLRVLLYSQHGAPRREAFERVAPDAKARLLTIARDDRATGFERDRARIALAMFGGDDVRALYDASLVDVNLDIRSRHRVLLAYARAFGVGALPALDTALSSPSTELRLTAISALISLSDPRAEHILAKAKRVPQPEVVRRELLRRN